MQFTGSEPLTPSAPMLTVVGCAPPPPYSIYPTLNAGQKGRGQSEEAKHQQKTLPGSVRDDDSSSCFGDITPSFKATPSDEEEEDENVVSSQPNGQQFVNMSISNTPTPQTVNYEVLYYAPTYSKTDTSECINCCEDCCEDVCENCCLNCCLDCSRIAHTIFGASNTGYDNLNTNCSNTGSNSNNNNGYNKLGRNKNGYNAGYNNRNNKPNYSYRPLNNNL